MDSLFDTRKTEFRQEHIKATTFKIFYKSEIHSNWFGQWFLIISYYLTSSVFASCYAGPGNLQPKIGSIISHHVTYENSINSGWSSSKIKVKSLCYECHNLWMSINVYYTYVIMFV